MKISIISILILLSFFSLAKSDTDFTASYAKLITVASFDDISASTLKTDDGFHYAKHAIPYTTDKYQLTDNLAIAGFIRGSYLHVKSDAFDLDGGDSYRAKWDIFSVVAGPRFTYQVNNELSFNGLFSFGYANINNKSIFRGDDEVRQELKDKDFLDWNVNNWILSSTVGVEYRKVLTNADIFTLNSNLSWSQFYSFKNTDSDLKVNNNTGFWSVGGDYTFTDALRIKDNSLNIVIADQIGGFYGKESRDLGFGFVNELKLAVEYPITFNNQTYHIQTGVGYLRGDNAHGISFLLQLN